ncbi:MAG: isochorismatase, partial [Promethearchaeota archaeon]
MSKHELPIPSHFDSNKIDEIWQVQYQNRFLEAQEWAKTHSVLPAAIDKFRICLMPIDVQNTFCLSTGELPVIGADKDNIRLCEFIYKNLRVISSIDPTLDTHTTNQIFHQTFWTNDAGEHPAPMTMISNDDVKNGTWKVSPSIAKTIGVNYVALQRYVQHYTQKLADKGKYSLCIWPFHSMLSGIGHALVASVEEAIFFHNITRNSQANYEIKGGSPLTENYSVLQPEVLDDYKGSAIAQKNVRFIEKLLSYDAIVIAGQAKSHCVAWTIADLLSEIDAKDPRLAKKVYLMEDCTSPVIVPGVVDFTDQANDAFKKFENA